MEEFRVQSNQLIIVSIETSKTPAKITRTIATWPTMPFYRAVSALETHQDTAQ